MIRLYFESDYPADEVALCGEIVCLVLGLVCRKLMRHVKQRPEAHLALFIYRNDYRIYNGRLRLATSYA